MCSVRLLLRCCCICAASYSNTGRQKTASVSGIIRILKSAQNVLISSDLMEKKINKSNGQKKICVVEKKHNFL